MSREEIILWAMAMVNRRDQDDLSAEAELRRAVREHLKVCPLLPGHLAIRKLGKQYEMALVLGIAGDKVEVRRLKLQGYERQYLDQQITLWTKDEILGWTNQ